MIKGKRYKKSFPVEKANQNYTIKGSSCRLLIVGIRNPYISKIFFIVNKHYYCKVNKF